MNELLKDAIDWMFAPTRYFLGSVLMLAAVFYFRKVVSRPIVIAAVFALATAFMVWAVRDPNFHKIITKGDNIPIVILLASVVFFSWLALRQAVIHDERKKRGESGPEHELGKQKVFTWPDLVYTEFICILLFTALLIVWSIVVEAFGYLGTTRELVIGPETTQPLRIELGFPAAAAGAAPLRNARPARRMPRCRAR